MISISVPRSLECLEEADNGNGAENCGTSRTAGVGSGTRFVSGRGEFEEETIDWKIEGVAEFFQMSNEELDENCVVFDAGTCVLNDGARTRATWKFNLKHTKENDEDWIGGLLSLQNDSANVKTATPGCTVSLSSGGNRIAQIKMLPFQRKHGEDFANCGRGVDKLMKKSEILERTMGTDSLEVSLLLKVFSNDRFKPVPVEMPSTVMQLQMGEEARADFLKMLETEVGANVEVKVPKDVGGDIDESSHTKKISKGILMARSSVFAAMFAQDSSMAEAQTGKIVIKELSPKGLEVFLRYIYTGEISDDWVKVPEEILNASAKYNLEKMKFCCGQNLISAVTTKNALALFKVAKLHKLSFAKNAIAKFISKNTMAVLDGYEENGEQGELEDREGRDDV